jgi:thiol-disulfide isomerase/thioredoxin
MKLLNTVIFTAALGVTAAHAKLKVGDDAPALKVAEWVQGEAVKELTKDNVYVVEFWATWCGPCVATIPHLDELHEELKDKGVVFIGQNCWERDLTKVKPFIEKMGEKMSYRVATDDTSSEEKGFMAVNWMQAAEQNGIPCAFVVGKDGKIAWIGHPAGLKADMLKEVAAGTFDVKKAAEQKEKEDAERAAGQAESMKLQKALKDGGMDTAIKDKDWKKAAEIIDAVEKEQPKQAAQLGSLRYMLGMRGNDSALVAKGAAQLLDSPAGDRPEVLNQVAWSIASKLKDPSAEALEAASKAATKGVEKTKSEDAALLDTLARVQFMQGKKEDAVKTLEKAVSIAKDEQKEGMEKSLESYKADKLPDVAEKE